MQRSKRILTSAAVSGLLALAALTGSECHDRWTRRCTGRRGDLEHRHASFHYERDHLALTAAPGVGIQHPCTAAASGGAQGSRRPCYGCPGGTTRRAAPPSSMSIFTPLAPSADADAANSVQARWTPVTVSANHPNSIRPRRLRTLHEMKDILSKNFSLRDLTTAPTHALTR